MKTYFEMMPPFKSKTKSKMENMSLRDSVKHLLRNHKKFKYFLETNLECLQFKSIVQEDKYLNIEFTVNDTFFKLVDRFNIDVSQYDDSCYYMSASLSSTKSDIESDCVIVTQDIEVDPEKISSELFCLVASILGDKI